jgi:hypothetical protein
MKRMELAFLLNDVRPGDELRSRVTRVLSLKSMECQKRGMQIVLRMRFVVARRMRAPFERNGTRTATSSGSVKNDLQAVVIVFELWSGWVMINSKKVKRRGFPG